MYKIIYQVLLRISRNNILVSAENFRKNFLDESPITAFFEHQKLSKILKSANIRKFSEENSGIYLKYMFSYLSTGFTKVRRRRALFYHYSYTHDLFVDGFYDALLRGRLVLWMENFDGDAYQISLGFDPEWHFEGDLTLKFARNGKVIYQLGFSIIPADAAGGETPMMFIGRVQGAIGQFQEIRQSTKAMNDVSPAHLLLCAAQAIAAAMSAPSIAGVSNQGQIAKTRGRRAEYEFDYDAFWMDFGFDKPNPDFFESPTIFKQRPLDQIPRSHRRRTRLKREFKDGVARRVKAAFTETVLSATVAAPQDDPR